MKWNECVHSFSCKGFNGSILNTVGVYNGRSITITEFVESLVWFTNKVSSNLDIETNGLVRIHALDINELHRIHERIFKCTLVNYICLYLFLEYDIELDKQPEKLVARSTDCTSPNEKIMCTFCAEMNRFFKLRMINMRFKMKILEYDFNHPYNRYNVTLINKENRDESSNE